MNSENKIKLLLLMQMLLVILQLIISIYLLVFVISYKLGGWMIASYIFITLSVIAIILYSIIGYKKEAMSYKLAIVPFMMAVFVNILLPNRVVFQVAILTILFALLLVFIVKLDDNKFARMISLLLVVIALSFSVYSAITADTQFLGAIDAKWPTYVAMYLSIFIPTVMTGTIALTYKLRKERE